MTRSRYYLSTGPIFPVSHSWLMDWSDIDPSLGLEALNSSIRSRVMSNDSRWKEADLEHHNSDLRPDDWITGKSNERWQRYGVAKEGGHRQSWGVYCLEL